MHDERVDQILCRGSIQDKIMDNFADSAQKPMYIYGQTGVGKSSFVKNLIANSNYDIIMYNSADMYDPSVVDNIQYTLEMKGNVLQMFYKNRIIPIVVIDNLEGINFGDRGGINSLMQLIKKSRISFNRLVCISTSHTDKKFKELMKLCNVIHMQTPTVEQMREIAAMHVTCDVAIRQIVEKANLDIRKLYMYISLYMLSPTVSLPVKVSRYYTDVYDTVLLIRDFDHSLQDMEHIANDSNRTIIGLVWYENVVDYIQYESILQFCTSYLTILDYLCCGDYNDRIIFQKQIWYLNELTLYIKIMSAKGIVKFEKTCNDVRFTKVLTKYSNEYSNHVFINNVCNTLNVERDDLLQITKTKDDILQASLNRLEYRRIYRIINKTEPQKSRPPD